MFISMFNYAPAWSHWGQQVTPKHTTKYVLTILWNQVVEASMNVCYKNMTDSFKVKNLLHFDSMLSP